MFIGYKDGSIIFGGTTNQPHDNLVITLDEMEQLAAFYQHEQDKTAVKEYLKTAINILGSAEISTELAKKYLYDAGLLDQLVEESNHSQENFGDNFLTSIAKGIEALEKRLDAKEWEGLPEPVANRMAHEFIAERNPCRWTGSGDAPDDVGFEPLNFPIDDIYYLCLTKQTNPFWSMTPAATTSSSMQPCSSRAPLTISGPRHPFIFCSNKKNLSTAYPYVKLAIRTMTSMVRSSCSRARLMTR